MDVTGGDMPVINGSDDGGGEGGEGSSGWHNAMVRKLPRLLDDRENPGAAEDILMSILARFGGERIGYFSFDEEGSCSCVYEAYASGCAPMKDRLQNIRADGKKGWISGLLAKEPVFIANDTGYATMAVPLDCGRNVRGFMKLDARKRPGGWSAAERESFLAAANVAGTCLALKVSLQDAVRNNAYLDKLYVNMPLGYVRIRMTLSEDGRVSDCRYIDANEKFLGEIGMRREDLIGKEYFRAGAVYPGTLDVQTLAEVAYQGRVYESRLNRLLHDDRYYNVTVYSPQPGDAVALFDDVTDTVEADKSLRRSKRELSKIYENIPVGIEVYDRNGILVDVNDKQIEILNVPDKEYLLGRNIFDHPSLPRFAYDLLMDGKDVTFDVNIDSMKLSRKDYYGVEGGDYTKYLTVKCTVLHDAAYGMDGILLIVIDNTAMYEANRKLREFESAFNSVAQIAEVGFFRWNPLKGIYFNSEQWYRNMGLNRGDRVSLAFSDYSNLIHPDDAATIARFIDAAVAGDAKSLSCEYRLRDGAGWKWLRTTIYVTEYDPDNDVVQFVGINYNINELKLSEQHLIEAKAKAEESDRLKSAFIANISHEIRTPLNAIVGFSNVLAVTDNEKEKSEYLSIIEHNNRHLLSLVSDLLDISKIESGAMEISIGEVRISDLCRQAVSFFSLRVREGVELKFLGESDGDGDVILGDAKLIMQVLSNMLSNAVKFTEQGHIWVDWRVTDGDMVELSVEDTGMGLDPHELEKVFDRFVKLNDFIPGTGLGLSISRNIVERLGGRIEAESRKGKGSRFWFTIPKDGRFYAKTP